MWHICHIISTIHTAVLVFDLGVIICVCHEGCSLSIILVVVVAVGKRGEAAGLVGIDGGGGWNGTIVGCLLIVDNNKLSVGVGQCPLWV